jgi:hypothetical protein
VFCFEKKYFKEGKFVMSQISILNKDHVWSIDINKINESLVNFLINIGIFPTSSDQELIFTNHEIFNEDAKKLGWEGKEYPILISKLYSFNNWIEICFRLFKKDGFKLVRKQLFIF